MARIKDIAAQLNVSPTTVSNVIHGKTQRVSEDTIRKVNELLAKENYVPNMGGVLLSQNNSMIIAIVLNDDVKYENKILLNPFVVEMISALEGNIRAAGYFTMLHNAHSIEEVAKIVKMWNISGLVLFGFKSEEYEKLSGMIRTPYVTIDALYEKKNEHNVNVGLDNYKAAYDMGRYLTGKGHREIVFLCDNDYGLDHVRKNGLGDAVRDAGFDFCDDNLRLLPAVYEVRQDYYRKLLEEIKEKKYTAMFFSSDFYAVEAMNYLMDHGIKIPEDVSVAGFDDITYATIIRPCLTTVKQDLPLKAATTVNALVNIIRQFKISTNDVILPVEIVERDSVGEVE